MNVYLWLCINMSVGIYTQFPPVMLFLQFHIQTVSMGLHSLGLVLFSGVWWGKLSLGVEEDNEN